MSDKKGEPRNTDRTEGHLEFQVIAETIQRVRTKSGKSQRGLSEELGKAHSYMGKVERQETEPSIVALLHIFELCEVNPGDTLNEIVAEVKHRRAANGLAPADNPESSASTDPIS